MPIGSKWYKFDFHNHTPASDDYQSPDISDREWLQSYMNAGVDAVVVSDHNTGARIDSLKDELHKMTLEAQTGNLESFRPLTLFPGVELTATGNVHILAIFHQESKGADIERLIGQCNGNAAIQRGIQNHQIVLQRGAAAIIGIIKLNPDVICILAHIDAAKGVLISLTNQAELDAAFSANPDGVEIRGALNSISSGTHKRLIKDLPKLRGSDAHSLGSAGTRTCWLKMSELNFDGMKNALLDHENCILFDTNPPTEPALQLKTLKFKTRLCNAADGQLSEIKFNPFYNAIIGSRGSGKSTIVESIRLAMRKVDGLSAKIADHLTKFKAIGNGMDGDSEIECIYQKDGHNFKLSWKANDTTSLHIMTDGEWIEDQNWSQDRFGISIYSQKMLFELASDNNAFLKVCDDSPFVNKRAWMEYKETLEREFKNERIKSRGFYAQKSSMSALTGELEDAERAIAKLSQSPYYPIRINLAHAENEEALASTKLSDAINKLNELSAQLIGKEPYTGTEEPQVLPSQKFTDFSSSLESITDNFDLKLTELIAETHIMLEGLENADSLTSLRKTVKEEKVRVEFEAEKLREQGLDPNTLDYYISRKHKIENELAQYINIDNDIQTCKTRIKDLYSEMQEHRNKLTIMRKSFIDSLSLDGLDIKILPLNAPPSTILSSYQSATGITSHADRIYDPQYNTGLLKEFIEFKTFSPDEAIINKKYDLLHKLKSLHIKLTNNAEIEGLDIHGSLKTRISGLSQESVDNLICWYPDDGIQIRYRALSGNMEDIHSASPGQKGASMLQFLLSYGIDPLILDQPEDDLDCMMLSQSVIPAITANKQRRQLIIVSHSAPIVVNGDAEYVISMIHDRQGLRPHICGALQEKEIKDLICKQMEGGEKAFRSRYSRILN